MLPARTGGTERVDAQIFGIQFQFHFLCLRHDGHRNGGGVDAPLCFGLRDTLHTMNAALKLHAAVHARPLDGGHQFLGAAQFGSVLADDLTAPPLFCGIHGVHPKQTVSK